MATDYKKLDIWHQAYKIALEVYEITKTFPEDEKNNIVSQLRRAAVSLPINIAEGASSRYNKNFLSQLNIAFASAKEIENLLLFSKDLHYISVEVHGSLAGSLDMLNSGVYKMMEYVSSLISRQEKTKTNSMGKRLKKEWFADQRSWEFK